MAHWGDGNAVGNAGRSRWVPWCFQGEPLEYTVARGNVWLLPGSSDLIRSRIELVDCEACLERWLIAVHGNPEDHLEAAEEFELVGSASS